MDRSCSNVKLGVKLWGRRSFITTLLITRLTLAAANITNREKLALFGT